MATRNKRTAADYALGAMGAMSKGVTDSELLILALAIGVGAYLLYTLYNTLTTGPAQLAAWAGQEVNDAESAIASGFNSSSGLNPNNPLVPDSGS